MGGKTSKPTRPTEAKSKPVPVAGEEKQPAAKTKIAINPQELLAENAAAREKLTDSEKTDIAEIFERALYQYNRYSKCTLDPVTGEPKDIATVVVDLLRKGANINGRGQRGEPVLYLTQKIPFIRRLFIDMGVDVNARTVGDSSYYTLLEIPGYRTEADFLQDLIDANINLKDLKEDVLAWAGRFYIAQLLLESGANFKLDPAYEAPFKNKHVKDALSSQSPLIDIKGDNYLMAVVAIWKNQQLTERKDVAVSAGEAKEKDNPEGINKFVNRIPTAMLCILADLASALAVMDTHYYELMKEKSVAAAQRFNAMKEVVPESAVPQPLLHVVNGYAEERFEGGRTVNSKNWPIVAAVWEYANPSTTQDFHTKPEFSEARFLECLQGEGGAKALFETAKIKDAMAKVDRAPLLKKISDSVELVHSQLYSKLKVASTSPGIMTLGSSSPKEMTADKKPEAPAPGPFSAAIIKTREQQQSASNAMGAGVVRV